MPIENVGPGGVSRSGGIRETTPIADAQRYYPEAGEQVNPIATFSTDANGNTVLVGPYGDGRVVVAPASGSAEIDTLAINDAIVLAGIGGEIVFPPGETYITYGCHELLSGQTVIGNLSTIKLAPQTTSVLKTGTTYSASATTVDVETPENFSVGQFIVVTSPVSALTAESTYYTDTSKYKATKPGKITSIVGQTITVDRQMTLLTGGSFTLSAANGALVAANAPVFVAGKAWSGYNSFSWATLPSGIRIYDLIIDGDRLNNTEGAFWNVAPALELYSHYLSMENVTVQNHASDAVVFSGKSPRISNCAFNTIDGNAVHPSSFDGTNGTEDMLVSGCSARDVLKTYKRGHGYGAFIYSNNSYDSKYINCHVDGFQGHAFAAGSNNTDARMILSGCTAKGADTPSGGGVRLFDGADQIVTGCTFVNCYIAGVSTLPNQSAAISEINASKNAIVSNCVFDKSPIYIKSSAGSPQTLKNIVFSGNVVDLTGLSVLTGASRAILVSSDAGTKERIVVANNVVVSDASASGYVNLEINSVSDATVSGNTLWGGKIGIGVYGTPSKVVISADNIVRNANTYGVELRTGSGTPGIVECGAHVVSDSVATLASTYYGYRVNNDATNPSDIRVRGASVDVATPASGGSTLRGIMGDGNNRNITLSGNCIKMPAAINTIDMNGTAPNTSVVVTGNRLSLAPINMGTAVVAYPGADSNIVG